MLRSNSPSITLAAASLAFASLSSAQESVPVSPATPPAMQAMLKQSMPGESHAIFARLIGKWRGTMRIWNAARPDAPPLESATESERRLVLGGRFLMEEATGSVMRMPMQRMSILGYNNVTNRYTLTFYSTMETAANTASGVANAAGTVLTLHGEFELADGKEPFKNVIRLEQDGAHVFESYKIMPDGKALKLIEQVMRKVE